MMKKMIGLMVRRPDMSPEQFRAYWSTTHAEITSKVPGLRSFVQSVCLPDANGDPAFDGVAVLGFDDAAGMEKALGHAGVGGRDGRRAQVRRRRPSHHHDRGRQRRGLT
jgi:uncharacterized protein (TIGR02118 family)